MNEFEPVSIGQIDRLVDGELSRDERRAVLMAIGSGVSGIASAA
jgi:anti-sigma factor RsiW